MIHHSLIFAYDFHGYFQNHICRGGLVFHNQFWNGALRGVGIDIKANWVLYKANNKIMNPNLSLLFMSITL